MSTVTELWVNRGDYRETKIVESPGRAITDGEIRVRIEKFGLTSNNVSYAVSGDMIGYWNYYPADDPWGKVPVWGIGEVVESNAFDITVGERLYGFFPMSSEVILTVGSVQPGAFMDASPHRVELPPLYNQYRRTGNEPNFLQAMEAERCLLFPLFMTSFVLYDYFVDNDYFGAEQIVIGSVSSKTGFGLAELLKKDGAKCVIGVTSANNIAFVESLGCCDQTVIYGNESDIDPSVPTAYVDMSGNAKLTETLHTLLGDNIVESCMVGATHWEKRGRVKDLPGAKPTFFFAPGQIAKRDKEWGPGVLWDKGSEAGVEIAKKVSGEISVEDVIGAKAAANIWKAMLNNQISPSRGLLVSIGKG
ncbi:MAG: DUF2855 family protein [Henriciella sp.]|jgi:NADPH:quinone reductase-like Zn-dependent oxidoreductase|nr:DUF2855 family protein [Henriciella sp.]